MNLNGSLATGSLGTAATTVVNVLAAETHHCLCLVDSSLCQQSPRDWLSQLLRLLDASCVELSSVPIITHTHCSQAVTQQDKQPEAPEINALAAVSSGSGRSQPLGVVWVVSSDHLFHTENTMIPELPGEAIGELVHSVVQHTIHGEVRVLLMVC